MAYARSFGSFRPQFKSGRAHLVGIETALNLNLVEDAGDRESCDGDGDRCEGGEHAGGGDERDAGEQIGRASCRGRGEISVGAGA